MLRRSRHERNTYPTRVRTIYADRALLMRDTSRGIKRAWVSGYISFFPFGARARGLLSRRARVARRKFARDRGQISNSAGERSFPPFPTLTYILENKICTYCSSGVTDDDIGRRRFRVRVQSQERYRH